MGYVPHPPVIKGVPMYEEERSPDIRPWQLWSMLWIVASVMMALIQWIDTLPKPWGPR